MIDDRRMPPRKAFWTWIAAGNIDGTLDLASEAISGYATEEEATEAARDIADEHGGEYYVFQVVPVSKVTKRRVRRFSAHERLEAMRPIAQGTGEPSG